MLNQIIFISLFLFISFSQAQTCAQGNCTCLLTCHQCVVTLDCFWISNQCIKLLPPLKRETQNGQCCLDIYTDCYNCSASPNICYWVTSKTNSTEYCSDTQIVDDYNYVSCCNESGCESSSGGSSEGSSSGASTGGSSEGSSTSQGSSSGGSSNGGSTLSSGGSSGGSSSGVSGGTSEGKNVTETKSACEMVQMMVGLLMVVMVI